MFIKTSQLLEHCVNRRTMKPVTLAENRVERTNVYKHIEIYKWVTQMTRSITNSSASEGSLSYHEAAFEYNRSKTLKNLSRTFLVFKWELQEGRH